MSRCQSMQIQSKLSWGFRTDSMLNRRNEEGELFFVSFLVPQIEMLSWKLYHARFRLFNQDVIDWADSIVKFAVHHLGTEIYPHFKHSGIFWYQASALA